MAQRFIVSDTHFGHRNIICFLKPDMTKLRPFDTIEEHDEALVENWNKVVGPKDSVYHLGDVVINRKFLPILDGLNGKKKLVRGNHDIFSTKDYMKYFDEIYGVRVFESRLGNIACSHMPIHEGSLGRYASNVHGHTHAAEILHKRYLPVSVEHTNFSPISWDDVLIRVEDRLNNGISEHAIIEGSHLNPG